MKSYLAGKNHVWGGNALVPDATKKHILSDSNVWSGNTLVPDTTKKHILSDSNVWGGNALVPDTSERLLLTANPVQARKGAVRGTKRQRGRSAERCALTQISDLHVPKNKRYIIAPRPACRRVCRQAGQTGGRHNRA